MAASTELFLLPGPYLRAIAEELARHDAGAEDWLAEEGFSDHAATGGGLDGTLEISAPRFLSLVVSAVERAREPALGLFVGQRLPVTAHGVLGYAAQTCGTLRQMLSLFESFLELRFPLLGVSVTARRHDVRVTFRERRPLGAARRPIVEAVMMATKNIVDAVAIGPSRIHRVTFSHERPRHAGLVRELFASEVEYGATWAGFALPASAMDEPLRAADPAAFSEAIAVCKRELARLPRPTSTADRVRRVLLEPQRGLPSLNVTARVLRLGARTLHRRLVAEGTSYREVLESVRHALAREHIKLGQLRTAEIATMLGYSDVSNFRRALRRWENASRRAKP